MARGPAKCVDYGIYVKLTGEDLKQELKNNPDSDGFSAAMFIQCKTQATANKCIGEYISIGRLSAGREYQVRRLSA